MRVILVNKVIRCLDSQDRTLSIVLMVLNQEPQKILRSKPPNPQKKIKTSKSYILLYVFYVKMLDRYTYILTYTKSMLI